MSAKERKLTKVQLGLLLCLYKFRFGTSSLLAISTGKKDDKFISPRLRVLVANEYIGRNYDKSYIKLAKPASFYLLPKALRTLREVSRPEGLSDQTIKASYKDKHASGTLIARSLSLYAIHNALAGLYSDLQLFLKRELADKEYHYFPKPLPDGFIVCKIGGETRYFFLEYTEANAQPSKLDYLLRKYVAYYENDEWEVTGLPFPPILCVTQDDRTDKVVRRQIIRVLGRSDTDLSIYTTTKKALLACQAGADSIWRNTKESDKLYNLLSISP